MPVVDVTEYINWTALKEILEEFLDDDYVHSGFTATGVDDPTLVIASGRARINYLKIFRETTTSFAVNAYDEEASGQLLASDTTYVWLSNEDTILFNQTSIDPSNGKIYTPLCTVVVGAVNITTITDTRDLMTIDTGEVQVTGNLDMQGYGITELGSAGIDTQTGVDLVLCEYSSKCQYIKFRIWHNSMAKSVYRLGYVYRCTLHNYWHSCRRSSQMSNDFTITRR
jgi:hypothetical protein